MTKPLAINFAFTDLASSFKGFQPPERGKPNDAGFDLRLCSLSREIVMPGECVIAGTGIVFEIPTGMFGMIADRSSMATKGWKVAGGIIDSTYRGEVSVVIWNISQDKLTLQPWDKIAQIIFMSHFNYGLRQINLEDLTETERGTNGFGSTGR